MWAGRAEQWEAQPLQGFWLEVRCYSAFPESVLERVSLDDFPSGLRTRKVHKNYTQR